jgi:EAL domain-containing protein (putative c-di-GMP-specific phosphodiesterase class I)
VASVWKAPFLLQDGELWASGSIGLATADRPGATATSLLREADAAMYSAKRVDGGGHAVYDEVMRSSAQARLQLDSALQRGLQEQQLRLHYQPVVDLQTGHWHGAEALVRWQHPERGLVPPDVFIPLAEQTRLIVPMGDWVLREGLRQLACWRRDGVVTADFVLSVNVSPRQLRGGFVDSVRTALRESGVPPACLALELTESVLLGESGELTAMLASLRGLGVGLHLDDFGTGYSPLTHLERVPMDQLKIDRGFTAGLLTSPRKVAVVHAIIAMAAAFDVPVTAEGVEVAEQAHLLRAGGCRYAQGYHYAAAADADETARTLARVPGERRDPAVRLTR